MIIWKVATLYNVADGLLLCEQSHNQPSLNARLQAKTLCSDEWFEFFIKWNWLIFLLFQFETVDFDSSSFKSRNLPSSRLDKFMGQIEICPWLALS